jgi:RNA polymerase sigma factor (sigma-70 family)
VTAVLTDAEHSELMLFLESMRPLLRFHLRLCQVPPQDAQDLLQETFVVLLASWHDRAAIDSCEGWLIGTLHHKIGSYWRLHRRERRLRDLIARQPRRRERLFAEIVESACDTRTLAAILPPRDVQLLWLRYALELDNDEAAQLLACRPDSVRKLCRRALRRTRERLALRR